MEDGNRVLRVLRRYLGISESPGGNEEPLESRLGPTCIAVERDRVLLSPEALSDAQLRAVGFEAGAEVCRHYWPAEAISVGLRVI